MQIEPQQEPITPVPISDVSQEPKIPIQLKEMAEEIKENKPVEQSKQTEQELKQPQEELKEQQDEQLKKEKQEEKAVEEERIKLFMWGSCEVDQYDPGEAPCIDGSCRSGAHIPLSQLFTFKEQIKSVHCGALHTFLLSNHGRVFSFGCNDDGVLGREGDEATPLLIKLPIRIDLLSTGDSHCVCGNSLYNRVFHWGVFRSINGNMTKPQRSALEIQWNQKKNLAEIVSGSNHCLIRTKEQKLYVCGDPECQVLGRVPGQRRRFQQALSFEGLNLKSVTKVWTGSNHAFVRLLKRKKGIETVIVKGWGSNNYGQLGLGDEDKSEQVMVPKDIIGIEHRRIKCMGGGEHHSVAVLEDGSVWTWGRNDEGELGSDIGQQEEGKAKFVRAPVRVPAIEKAIVEDCIIGATFNYVVAGKGRKQEQQVYSWGNGDMYILGNGREENEREPYQVKNAFFKKMVVVQIALGAQHGAFLVKEEEDGEEVEFDEGQLRILEEEKVVKGKSKKDQIKEKKEEQEEEKKIKKEKDDDHEDIKEEEKKDKQDKKKKDVKKSSEKKDKKSREKKEKKQKAATTKKKKDKQQEKKSSKSRAKSLSKEPRKKSKSKSPQIKKIKDKIEEEGETNKQKKKQGKGKKSPNPTKRLHDDAFKEEKPNQEIANPLQKIKE